MDGCIQRCGAETPQRASVRGKKKRRKSKRRKSKQRAARRRPTPMPGRGKSTAGGDAAGSALLCFTFVMLKLYLQGEAK